MRILILDIETSPNLAFCWGLWDQTIQLNQLVSTSEMLCWAAKWHGSKEIMFGSKNIDNRTLLTDLHKLLSEADAVVHYNGKSFDMPTINKEFLLHKMKPPSPYHQIDLIDTSRKVFKFQSNRLEFVSQTLGIGKKTKHEGFDLWKKCLAGDPKAWKTMEKYNKQDVLLTEKLYKEFLPWIQNHPNVALLDGKEGCPSCGSKHVQKRGTSVTVKYRWQRYQCLKCGHWYKGERI